MLPPPPTRFSTTSCWPRRSPSFCATRRATGSELLPAVNATMTRIRLFRQHPLASHRLRLTVPQGAVAALTLVAIQNVRVRVPAQDADELLRQVECVMNAAVHANGADRAVHMRVIAGKHGATGPEFFRPP